jgi:hypothetical protein
MSYGTPESCERGRGEELQSGGEVDMESTKPVKSVWLMECTWSPIMVGRIFDTYKMFVRRCGFAAKTEKHRLALEMRDESHEHVITVLGRRE